MPPKKYIAYGSTTITVPPNMIGYRKQKPFIFPTLTPTRKLSYHNKKLAIKLLTNPRSNYKIQRVPKTTKYYSI